MRIKTEGKRILTFLFTVILMLCMSLNFVGCFYEYTPQYEPDLIYGDFTYCYVTSATSNNKVSKDEAIGVNILELVGEAREKDTIIIPETIDGLPVIAIGMNGLGWAVSLKLSGGQYNKIYLPKYIQRISHWDIGSEDKRFFLNVPQVIGIAGFCYIPEEDFVQYKNHFEQNNQIDKLVNIQIANLTYMVEDELFWIDDCEIGESIIFPEDPIKEGFTFDGWYKDEEFFKKWDEKSDTYKPENAKTLKLYAKFIEEK